MSHYSCGIEIGVKKLRETYTEMIMIERDIPILAVGLVVLAPEDL